MSARTSTRDENLMLGNAGSDERILIQEIFEPKLLSTVETHARVYAAGKHVDVVLGENTRSMCISAYRAYPCSRIPLLSHSSGVHMAPFATLALTLSLLSCQNSVGGCCSLAAHGRRSAYFAQFYQPIQGNQHILAVAKNPKDCVLQSWGSWYINTPCFDPTSAALCAITLKRKTSIGVCIKCRSEKHCPALCKLRRSLIGT